jgi:hypothetical protein
LPARDAAADGRHVEGYLADLYGWL